MAQARRSAKTTGATALPPAPASVPLQAKALPTVSTLREALRVLGQDLLATHYAVATNAGGLPPPAALLAEARMELGALLQAELALARGLPTPGGRPAPGAKQASEIARRAAVAALLGLAPTATPQGRDWQRVTAASLSAAHEAQLDDEAGLDAAASAFSLRPGPRQARRMGGSFYTPLDLVASVLDAALAPLIAAATVDVSGKPRPPAEAEAALLALRIVDPACGSGHILVAALHRLAAVLARVRCAGAAPEAADLVAARVAVAERCIFGLDVDAAAVELCRLALWLEVDAPALAWSVLERAVCLGDALSGPAQAPNVEIAARHPDPGHALGRNWARAFPEVFAAARGPATALGVPGGFDCVIGNPPFLAQRRRSTARPPSAQQPLRSALRGALAGQTDSAGAFLALAPALCRRGALVALVQPLSVLAARDATGVRDSLCAAGALRGLWTSETAVFSGTTVLTCWICVEVGAGQDRPIDRFSGPSFRALPPRSLDAKELLALETWSELAGLVGDAPDMVFESRGVVGDIAGATADFRDQYYGLQGFIRDDPDRADAAAGATDPPLLTTGLLDLAGCAWGERPTRIHKHIWQAPRVDRAAMVARGRLGPWMASRLVPKAIVATQTRALEVFVDAQGRYLPSLPLITVTAADTARLWAAAAAIASPVATWVARRRYAGAALHVDAIKLSASQVESLPLPAHPAAAAAAAEAFALAHACRAAEEREAVLRAFAEASCAAYGVEGADAAALCAWWARRAFASRRRPNA